MEFLIIEIGRILRALPTFSVFFFHLHHLTYQREGITEPGNTARRIEYVGSDATRYAEISIEASLLVNIVQNFDSEFCINTYIHSFETV